MFKEKFRQPPAANPAEIDQAMDNSRIAFDDWVDYPLEKRIQLLQAFRQVLESEKDTLATIISEETGKALWDSKSEVLGMMNKIAISIDAYNQRCPKFQKDISGTLLTTYHRPHGVVAVFGPYNFPGHLPNGHIVPALLAGNTIIFKPSELAPITADFTLSCWLKAGLPKNVLQIVHGGPETGQYLSRHPGLDGLLFTGSAATGKLLMQHYANYPEKILALEMGGNNPLIVHEISNIPAAVFATIQSAYISSGQRCTCARRLILVENEQTKAFLTNLVDTIRTIKVGYHTDFPEPFMGPVISEAAATKLLAAQAHLKSLGGKSLIEMTHLKPTTGLLSPGLIDVTDIKDLPDEEYFGPLLQVICVATFNEAITVANQTRYGLAAGLLSDSNAHYKEFFKKIKAGIVNWNTQLTGASSTAPFGGIKQSGNFRPSAYYAADYSSYPVASMENTEIKVPLSLPPGIQLLR